MKTIEIKNLTKQFQDVTALNNISLTIEEGKIYGLLGRNGAGKSTLLNIISNRIYHYKGEVLLEGISVRENDLALGSMFLMSEDTLYPEFFSFKKAMETVKDAYGGFDTKQALKMCEMFGLNIKKKIKGLSTGYKSIFKLILALNVDVPFIFLDEPVLGLDANHRELFYKLLMKTYGENPRTFVISTHLIEEISTMIEEIIIIKQGELLYKEDCEELLSRGYAASGTIADVDVFSKGKNIKGEDVMGGLKTVYIMERVQWKEVPDNIQITKLDLQKLFIQLTNQ